MADNFTPTPYVNPMAKQLNGPIIQALLKAKHAMFSADGDELIAHRNYFSVDIATTQELEWLGLFCNVPRPYAVIDGEIVQATDDEYKLFFKNVMALRQSQSLLSLAEVFYQFLPNGEFQLQINETTGDIRVILDARYDHYLPFLQQAATSVFTASPQLQPFESRDYYSYIFDDGLYLRYIQLAQPNFWEFEYNATKHAFTVNSHDLEALTLGFDDGQLTLDQDQEGYFIPRDGCISPETAFIIEDGAIKLKDGYITYNTNEEQNTDGKGVFARNPFNVTASPAITYDVMYAPRDESKPLPIEADYMAFLVAYDADLHALIMNNVRTISPYYIENIKTCYKGVLPNYAINEIIVQGDLVVLATSSGAWWSEDGKNWTQGTGANTSYSMRYPVYENGLWVCGSSGHGLWWSADGKAWTQGTGENTTFSMQYLVYENGLWVCGSSGHGTWWSADGKAWTQGTGENTTFSMQYLVYANGLWVCGSSGHGTWWSADGKAWTQGTGGNTTFSIQYLAYADGIWVCGSSGYGLWWSEDGKAWTRSDSIPSESGTPTLYYANSLWQYGSSSGSYYSENGKDWTRSSPHGYNARVLAFYYANGVWLLSMANVGIYWSTDGKVWNDSNVTFNRYSYFIYSNGIWMVEGVSRGCWWSEDGKNWFQCSGENTTRTMNTPAYFRGLFIWGTSNYGVWYCGIDLGDLDTTGYYKDKIANYGKQSLDKVERSALTYDPSTHSANVKIFDTRRIAVMNVTQEE